jgi:membrane fusion protein, copper/silver efflux system
MKRLLTLLPLLLAFSLAACQTEAPAEQTTLPDQPGEQINGTAEATPRMENGMQVIQIEATASGFNPEHITLEEGVPTRLVVTRTTGSACMEQIQVPQFGIERTDLPRDEPVVIEFTPDQTGAFTFGCGMDMMMRGTILVRS